MRPSRNAEASSCRATSLAKFLQVYYFAWHNNEPIPHPRSQRLLSTSLMTEVFTDVTSNTQPQAGMPIAMTVAATVVYLQITPCRKGQMANAILLHVISFRELKLITQ